MSSSAGRRRLVAAVLAAAVVGAAIVVASLAAAADSPEPTEAPYQPPTTMPSGVVVRELPDGTWMSPLLPFARPFPTREALERALDDARDQGLIG